LRVNYYFGLKWALKLFCVPVGTERFRKANVQDVRLAKKAALNEPTGSWRMKSKARHPP